MRSLSLMFLLAALLLPGFADAQTSPTTAWKKRVARTIDLAEKEDTVRHHLRNAGNDSSLTQLLVKAVMSGQLDAYRTWDASLAEKMTATDLKNALGLIPDTLIVVDPITGEEIRRIRAGEVDYDHLQKFRLLEDWTYYPGIGRTEIQIVGIGPVRDVYGGDGDYRGQQIVFWLKYNDAKRIIDRYEQYHPNNTVGGHIWNDYFLSEVKPKPTK